MPSKYCSACNDLVSTAGFVPNYCGWCGKDLSDVPLFPEFSTYTERVGLLKNCNVSETLKTECGAITETGQLSLF